MRALLVTVLLTSTLAACADEPPQPSAVGTEAPVIVPRHPGATARTATPGERLGQVPPTPTAADVRFAEGMIPHHRQALEMAGLVPDRTGTETIRAFAEQIAISQKPEIGIMSSWLSGLGRRVPSGHDHGAMAGGDYGMATDDQMRALRAARGGVFDRMFLQLMIRHHEGALKMAQEQLDGGKDQRMRLLARDVYAGQSIEIARMKKILGELPA